MNDKMPDLSHFSQSQIELQIAPGTGFANNAIKLGSSLNRLIDCLSSTSCQFVYSLQSPLSTPYILKVSKLDLNLLFNQASQRLVLIELNNLTSLKGVRYTFNGKLLKQFDLKEIYNVIFGPTYNGQVLDGKYILSYPGISFKFNVPPNIIHDNTENATNLFNTLFSKNPKVESIAIHSFNHYSQMKKNSNLINLSTNPNPIELEKLVINGKTIALKFLKHSQPNIKSCELIINHSNLQDILMLIGPPDEIFIKDDSKQKIHSTPTDFINGSNSTSVRFNNLRDESVLIFHNYYSFGLDLLYDNNKLVKLIIHNNIPLNYLSFGKYEKCQFEIPVFDQSPLSKSLYGELFDNAEIEENIIYNDLYFDEVFTLLQMENRKIKPILINRSNYSNSNLEIINHEYENVSLNEFGDFVSPVTSNTNNDEKKQNHYAKRNEFQSLVYVDHEKNQIWEVIGNCIDSLVLY